MRASIFVGFSKLLVLENKYIESNKQNKKSHPVTNRFQEGPTDLPTLEMMY